MFVVIDGIFIYKNVFDVSFDVFILVLIVEGYFVMEILFGEIGWFIDGNEFVNLILVGKYN